jgi:hypothetical protein
MVVQAYGSYIVKWKTHTSRAAHRTRSHGHELFFILFYFKSDYARWANGPMRSYVRLSTCVYKVPV